MKGTLLFTTILTAALALAGCGGGSTGAGSSDGGGDTDGDADTDSETTTGPEDDNDGDGLSNGDEEAFGTDPEIPDSDGDGASDYLEWVAGTDPLDPGSNPTALGDFVFRMPYAFDPQPAQAVLAVASGGAAADLSAAFTDDPEDGEDAAALVDRITPNAAGGIEDPLHPGTFCASGLETADDDGDSLPDRFVAVPPGTTVCFDVVPDSNQSIIPASGPRIYKAFADVLADGATAIDDRTIYFFVPGSSS